MPHYDSPRFFRPVFVREENICFINIIFSKINKKYLENILSRRFAINHNKAYFQVGSSFKKTYAWERERAAEGMYYYCKHLKESASLPFPRAPALLRDGKREIVLSVDGYLGIRKSFSPDQGFFHVFRAVMHTRRGCRRRRDI